MNVTRKEAGRKGKKRAFTESVKALFLLLATGMVFVAGVSVGNIEQDAKAIDAAVMLSVTNMFDYEIKIECTCIDGGEKKINPNDYEEFTIVYDDEAAEPLRIWEGNGMYYVTHFYVRAEGGVWQKIEDGQITLGVGEWNGVSKIEIQVGGDVPAGPEVKKHTVRYYVEEEQIGEEEVEDGACAQGKAPKELEGKKFKGWFLGEEKYEFGKPVTQDLELRAKYETIQIEVRFHIEGYEDEIVTVEYGGVVDENAVQPKEIEGKEFKGWYLGEEEYNFKSPVKKEITLEARYETIQIEVRFHIEGYDDVIVKVEYGGVLDENAVQPKEIRGKEFMGWYLGEEKYDFKSPVKKEITLEGRYEKKKMKVTFRFEGEEKEEKEVEVAYGEWLREEDYPEVKERDGYEFEGWFRKGEIYKGEEGIYEDMELEGRYREKEYTLRFWVNGKLERELSGKLGEGKVGPEVELKEGERFVGWYDEKGEEWDGTVKGDMNLYARIEEGYVIKVEAEGREYEVKYGEAFEPERTEKEGYTFQGWYLDAGFENEYDGVIKGEYGETVHLYAKYTASKVHVKVHVGEKTYEYELNYKDRWNWEEIEPEEGYEIKEFRTEDGEVWEDEELTKDTELWVVMEKKRYTVTFEIEGEEHRGEWEYGSMPEPPEETEEERRERRIMRWEPEIEAVRGEARYVAVTEEVYYKEYYIDEVKVYEEYAILVESNAPREKAGRKITEYKVTQKEGRKIRYDAYSVLEYYVLTIEKENGARVEGAEKRYEAGAIVKVNVYAEKGYEIKEIRWEGEITTGERVIEFTMPARDVTIWIETEEIVRARETVVHNELCTIQAGWERIAEGYDGDYALEVATQEEKSGTLLVDVKLHEAESEEATAFANGRYFILRVTLPKTLIKEDRLLFGNVEEGWQEVVKKEDGAGGYYCELKILGNGTYVLQTNETKKSDTNAILITLTVLFGIGFIGMIIAFIRRKV